MNAPLNPFREDRPELKGFGSFYYDEIFPFLHAKEHHRQKAVKKAFMWAMIVGIVCFALAALLFVKLKSPMFPVFLVFVGFAGGTGFAAQILRKVKGETKIFLMEKICGFVDWQYQEKGFLPPDLDLLISNDLLKKYDRVSFEDQMSGNAHGADFVFCEAHLEREEKDSNGGKKWVTVFRGILMDVDFDRDFLGRTVVLRDAGWFNRKAKKGMKKVGLVDPVFEKIFEAYSTDQVEARYLLTPTFMQRLVDLETIVSGKKVRFGFLGDKLRILIEAPNQFEAGSMFKPLTETKRTEKILSEISGIYGVVDSVLKPLEKRYK